MKKLTIIFKALLILLVVNACTDERDLDFLEAVKAPTNVAAAYNIVQDNSGLVTITPTAEGANSFDVYFGDDTTEPVNIEAGNNVQHTYLEGSYTVKIVAYNAKGDTTEANQELVVSFKAPENVVVTLENNIAISKQVNIMATADYATTYEFYSGETDVTQPVATANIGDAISYQYANAGTYTINVIVKGGAIETTEYTVDFEVTEILAPISSAGTPPTRSAENVISIFSDAYTNVANTDFNPNWGQQTTYTAFDLNGDAMLQYSNLNYQGIQIGATQDVSSMEFLHLDVWTADATELETYLISIASGEKFIKSTLTKDAWTSINIPISEFTDQGLSVQDIHQFKFVGAGSVFIDNLYFYKAPSGTVSTTIEDFEGTAPVFTDFGNIAPIEVVDNPSATGINTTNKVAKFVKTSNAETWAGAFFDVAAPLDVVNNNKITIKTWSPKSGATVRFKIENASDNTQFVEVDAITTTTNAWEELTFDISSAVAGVTYNRVVIFFDFGNVGDDAVYYYDEINLVNESAGSSAPVLFQDFEGTTPVFTDFGNIAPIEVVDNPNATGVNTTSKAAKFVKTANAETWAGAFFDISSPIDVVNYSKVVVKTYSPKSGVTVRFKMENAADGAQFVEVDATTSKVNEWEELTFDISEAVAGTTYDRIVIFFDFGNTGDDAVYYYDELGVTN
ncbi:PKD domain protein [Polaribacter sargassicola]|uniref:PKD domain protein n=1 Tax=Polaribacter sargassicola TaxID=2836891 RepID=UPI001F277C44|nr:PKD domain protein [Polaribacter sp. DS7-9]